MASVLGTDDDARARPAAAALGMAMQRTNILRDLDEDGAAGRAYLARETTDRFGAPVPGAREGLLRDQIAKADARYEEGLAGVRAAAQRPRGRPRRGVDVPRDPAPDRARRLRRARRPRDRAAAAQALGGRARASPDDAAGRVTWSVPAVAGTAVACGARPASVILRRRLVAAGVLLALVVGVAAVAGAFSGDDAPPAAHAPSAGGGSAAPARPELPGGGRSILPGAPRRRLLRRAAGRRARARSASARPTRPRGGSREQARPYDAGAPPGAAGAGAHHGDRQRRRGHGRHVPHAPAGRRHPPLPARRAAPRDAAGARHPARPLGLLHRGDAAGALAARAGRRPRARPRVARERGRGAGPGDRARRRARGQRDVGVAGAARRRGTTCRRSCSSCTSSPTTWSTTRSSSAATGSRWCSTPTASAPRP